MKRMLADAALCGLCCKVRKGVAMVEMRDSLLPQAPLYPGFSLGDCLNVVSKSLVSCLLPEGVVFFYLKRQ